MPFEVFSFVVFPFVIVNSVGEVLEDVEADGLLNAGDQMRVAFMQEFDSSSRGHDEEYLFTVYVDLDVECNASSDKAMNGPNNSAELGFIKCRGKPGRELGPSLFVF